MSEQKFSESFLFVSLLTLAGGLQDSYSYLLRGEVFANAQTGNVVLLAQNLAHGNFETAFHYFIPLLSFIFGVYLTVPILLTCKDRHHLLWMQIVLFFELILLFAVGWIPSDYNILANSLMSFTCAMQVNSFRSFRGMPAATTMCIGNLRSGTDLLAKYHSTGEKKYKTQSAYYFGIIFVFFLGAALGTLFRAILGLKTIWISAFCLFLAFLFLAQEKRNDDSDYFED